MGHLETGGGEEEKLLFGSFPFADFSFLQLLRQSLKMWAQRKQTLQESFTISIRDKKKQAEN